MRLRVRRSQTEKLVITHAAEQRCAAILICVLVVLLIVGLLATQTLQTLMLLRRGDHQRQQLRQTREVVELGLLIARRLEGKLPESELVVPLGMTAPADQSASENHELAGITLTRVEDRPTPALRVTVRYPLGGSNEVTATETVAIAEENHANTHSR